jgi:hypothetical protein
MLKLIGMKPPRRDPCAYIVVLETGTYWANESGAITGRVAHGTFHAVTETRNPFADALLVATTLLSNFQGMEERLTRKIADLAAALGAEPADGVALRHHQAVITADEPSAVGHGVAPTGVASAAEAEPM